VKKEGVQATEDYVKRKTLRNRSKFLAAEGYKIY
jgi:hypothetical protein